MTKTLFVGSLALLVALVIAISLIPVLIDPNNYKTDITSLIKDKTGCDVSFEGAIKLSLFPWIGLSAEKIVINNPSPAFQQTPFATIDKGDIKVKLLPLVMNKIEANTVALDGLNVNLVTDKQGKSNWSEIFESRNLVPPGATTPLDNSIVSKQGNQLSAFAALTVSGIAIQNARVNWNNLQTAEDFELKNVRFNADKFVFGEPVKIDVVFDVSGKQLTFPGSVNGSADIRIDEKLDNVELTDTQLAWLGTNKSGTGKSFDATVNITNVVANIAQETFQLSGLQLQSGEFKLTAEVSGTQFMSKPAIQSSIDIASFNPSNFLKQSGIALPVMSDAKALTNLAMKFQLQANSDVAEFNDLNMVLDDSSVKGTVTVKDFAHPSVLFDLMVDTINADHYLQPPGKSAKFMASPGLGFAAGAISLPLEWLRKFDAEGKLALGKLTLNQMVMQDIQLTLSSKKGIVKVEQTANRFYQGSYSGNFNVDASSEKSLIAINEKLTNIHLEPFLIDTQGEAKLGGIITTTSQLSSQGNNTKELRSNLSGQVNFFLKEAYVKGFNLEKMIENSRNLVKGGAFSIDAKHDKTVFSEIKGTAAISKGVLVNDDLVANTAKLRSAGKGNVNLQTGQLDYKLTTRLVKTSATASAPEQVHETPIVIHLGGTFAEPTYGLDVGALLTDKNKAKIERLLDNNKDKIEKLMNKLDKKLGPGASDLLKKIF